MHSFQCSKQLLFYDTSHNIHSKCFQQIPNLNFQIFFTLLLIDLFCTKHLSKFYKIVKVADYQTNHLLLNLADSVADMASDQPRPRLLTGYSRKTRRESRVSHDLVVFSGI